MVTALGELPLSKPAKNIAVAMSGGGFRAAAFSLGTLSFLNELQDSDGSFLLKVKFIGSTSGGSITNIAYTQSVCNRDSFDTFYHRLLSLLDGEQLIETVFKILENDRYWKERKDKSRNVINAFAIAYDTLLYNGQTFGTINNNITQTHLEDICVNATEFSNGISFRFQSQAPRSGFKKGRIGNNYIYFLEEQLKVGDKLKLGDLLACSSCFTGGFEPFIFPDDFTHSDLDCKELSEAIHYEVNPFTPPDTGKQTKEKERFRAVANRFGIMDGGVADNQAIDSVLLANKRRPDDQKFDLVIVTDVTSYFMDGYSLPLINKSSISSLPLNVWKYTWMALSLVLPIAMILAFRTGWQPWMSWIAIPSGLLLAAWIWMASTLNSKRADAVKYKNTWSLILFKYVGYFLRIPFYSVRQMLKTRLKSTFLLANDIYLKQIRRQYYQYLYNDPAYTDKIVANAIYDLSTVRQKMLAEKNAETKKAAGGIDLLGQHPSVPVLSPSGELEAVAEMARIMDTTLWFDEFQSKAHTKAAIVATGQFTTCYNLLKQAQKTGCFSPEITQQLQHSWEKFNKDPFWLYNLKSAAVPGFAPMVIKAIPGRFIITDKPSSNAV